MIRAGDTSTFEYRVPVERTVPHLFPESAEFAGIPPVFATGYLVGLLEWACVRAMNEHESLAAGQTSVGTHIDVSHTAATLPGQVVTVEVTCTGVDGRALTFDVSARDERDEITRGTHQRAIIDRARFFGGLAKKAQEVGVAAPEL